MFERWGQRLRAYAERDGRGYPDWAVRYVPLVKRLQQDGLQGKRIVEIGANENGFARFAGVQTIAVDLSAEHLHATRASQDVLPVVADIAALPFRDGSVDICVCVDTLEHLADALRPAALQEIARVIAPEAGCAVIAFPSGVDAVRAERVIQSQYHALTGQSIRWLDEHAETGLPDADAMAQVLATAAPAGHRVVRGKNATVVLWQWMWQILMCGWPGRGNAVFQALLRLATPLLCRVHWGRCYRQVLWLEPRSRGRR